MSLAHPLVAGVQDQIRERLLQASLGKRPQGLVQRLVDGADRRGREGVAAQRLGHRLDLAGRHTLHVHLGQGADQGLLGALVALEQLGRKAPVAILRHAQLQRPDPGDQ